MALVPILDVLLLFIAFSSEWKHDREKLYKAIRDGDEQAFRLFFDEHYDSLFVFLKNRNITRDVAEDLIQNAFIYIWENRHKIKPDLSLKAYLFQIVYSRMLNYVESRKHFLDVETQVNGVSKTPQDSAEFSDLYGAFRKAISEMPEKRRIVFESCFLQELTYKETARNLSISVKTVENHMALAFRDMRKSLNIFNKS